MPSTDSLQSLEGKGALPQVYGQPVTFTATVTSIFDPPPDGETVSCEMRGIQPGPINTFPGWKALGRHVLKGQKAISLVMPITGKKRDEENQQAPDAADSHDSRKSECFTRFVFRRTGLYCLNPKATTLPPRPRRNWNAERALSVLGVTRVEFTTMNGNAQGYAAPGKQIAERSHICQDGIGHVEHDLKWPKAE